MHVLVLKSRVVPAAHLKHLLRSFWQERQFLSAHGLQLAVPNPGLQSAHAEKLTAQSIQLLELQGLQAPLVLAPNPDLHARHLSTLCSQPAHLLSLNIIKKMVEIELVTFF